MKKTDLTRRTMDDFRRIVQALRTSHRVAEDLHLSGAQLFVLSVLHEADGPLSVGDIARETQTDPSTASTVISRLADAGYVKRVRAADDSRRMQVTLTARGSALRRRYPVSAPQRRLAEALRRLSLADSSALARILGSVVAEMGLHDEEAPMMFADEGRPARRNPNATATKRRARR